MQNRPDSFPDWMAYKALNQDLVSFGLVFLLLLIVICNFCLCSFVLQLGCSHRRNNRRDRGRLVPQLLGWGPTMYWSPNFLAVVFKNKKFHSKCHQNAGFSIWVFKNFPGVIPQTLTAGGASGRGRPPPTPNTQTGLWPGAGRKRPSVGTQTLVPFNFLAVVAPRLQLDLVF